MSSIVPAALLLGYGAAATDRISASFLDPEYLKLVARAKEDGLGVPEFASEWISLRLLQDQIPNGNEGLGGQSKLIIDASCSVEDVWQWYQKQAKRTSGEATLNFEGLAESLQCFVDMKKDSLPEFPIKHLKESIYDDKCPLSSLRAHVSLLSDNAIISQLLNQCASGEHLEERNNVIRAGVDFLCSSGEKENVTWLPEKSRPPVTPHLEATYSSIDAICSSMDISQSNGNFLLPAIYGCTENLQMFPSQAFAIDTAVNSASGACNESNLQDAGTKITHGFNQDDNCTDAGTCSQVKASDGIKDTVTKINAPELPSHAPELSTCDFEIAKFDKMKPVTNNFAVVNELVSQSEGRCDSSSKMIVELIICCKCSKTGNLIRCTLCSCAVHERCLGCSASFDDGGFVCPKCVYSNVVAACKMEKKMYSRVKNAFAQARKDLYSFLGSDQAIRQFRRLHHQIEQHNSRKEDGLDIARGYISALLDKCIGGNKLEVLGHRQTRTSNLHGASVNFEDDGISTTKDTQLFEDKQLAQESKSVGIIERLKKRPRTTELAIDEMINEFGPSFPPSSDNVDTLQNTTDVKMDILEDNPSSLRPKQSEPVGQSVAGIYESSVSLAFLSNPHFRSYEPTKDVQPEDLHEVGFEGTVSCRMDNISCLLQRIDQPLDAEKYFPVDNADLSLDDKGSHLMHCRALPQESATETIGVLTGPSNLDKMKSYQDSCRGASPPCNGESNEAYPSFVHKPSKLKKHLKPPNAACKESSMRAIY